MAHISLTKEALTKVIGRTISSMGMGSKCGQMVNNIKDTTKKARKMELALIVGLMDQNIQGAGKITKYQELVHNLTIKFADYLSSNINLISGENQFILLY